MISSNEITDVKMQHHHSQDPQSGNLFLTLPAELRNTIYDLVLFNPSRHTKSGRPIANPEKYRVYELRTMFMPALVRTCRQILKEAISYMLHNASFVYTVIIYYDWTLHTKFSKRTISLFKLAGLQHFKIPRITFRLVSPTRFNPRTPGMSKSKLCIEPICTVAGGQLIERDVSLEEGAPGAVWTVEGRPMEVFWNRVERCALDDMNVMTIEKIAEAAVEAPVLERFLAIARTARSIEDVARIVARMVSLGGTAWLDGRSDEVPGIVVLFLSMFTVGPILLVGNVVRHSGYKRWKIWKIWDRTKRPFGHGRRANVIASA